MFCSPCQDLKFHKAMQVLKMRSLSISHLHSPDKAVRYYLCCSGWPECISHSISWKRPCKSHTLLFWGVQLLHYQEPLFAALFYKPNLPLL